MEGGASGKYCKITQYLKQHEPALLEAIEDMCLWGIFNVRRGVGVTFLLPEKTGIKQILATAKTDPAAAAQIVLAHTLDGYFSSATDVKRGPAINKLHMKLDELIVSALGPGDAYTTYNAQNPSAPPLSAIFRIGRLIDPKSGIRVEKRGAAEGGGRMHGGNDEAFTRDGRSGLTQHDLRVVIDMLCTQSETRCRLDIKTIDVLTHTQISLHNWLSKKAATEGGSGGHFDSLRRMICEYSGSSALSVLFSLPLLTAGEIREFYSAIDMGYDDAKTYRDRIAAGPGGAEYYTKIYAKKRELIKQSIGKDVIVSQINEFFMYLHNEVMAPECKAAAAHVFGSPEAFCKWRNSALQFQYLFTADYLAACAAARSGSFSEKTRGAAAIKRVFECFQLYCLPEAIKHAQESKAGCHWCRTYVLTDPDMLGGSKPIELFCTILSYFVNTTCGDVGGPIPALITYASGFSAPAPPNTISQRSQFNEVFSAVARQPGMGEILS